MGRGAELEAEKSGKANVLKPSRCEMQLVCARKVVEDKMR